MRVLRPSRSMPLGHKSHTVPVSCRECAIHLHRAAFPGTARQGRCGAVQVSKALRSIPVGCAFDENYMRLGLVSRNEYPAWYFYREKS